jgi:hypothetical protein
MAKPVLRGRSEKSRGGPPFSIDLPVEVRLLIWEFAISQTCLIAYTHEDGKPFLPFPINGPQMPRVLLKSAEKAGI